MTLKLIIQNTGETVEFNPNYLFNGGFAGSDQSKIQDHIEELSELGVPVPKTTPTLYPIANYLLTTTDHIQVQHEKTSGEIEYVLIWLNNEMYITVGSDHTDRKLEGYSIPMAKQAYPNIISNQMWKFSDIQGHWDKIELECWVTTIDGEKQLYQKGTCSDLLAPIDWAEIFSKLEINNENNVFFSATINTVTKSLNYFTDYEISMHDPILNRTIKHRYSVDVLPKAIE